MKLAVLLTVHNRRAITIKCLEGLFKQKIPQNCKLDVFMTDDGCTDGTPEEVNKLYPQVNIIQGDGNLFWNRGMYRAWEEAAKHDNYDYYLWLNDDTTLLPGSIREMLAESVECPDSIIVGSTHSASPSNELTYGGICSRRIIMPNGNIQKCDTFNGNIVLIPNSIYKLLGNLDWTYQHAIGDLDYGYRCSEAGKNIYLSRRYRGCCNKNEAPPKWTRPDIPFRERWNNFHSPLGYAQPGPFFHYNKKHFGLLKAIRIYITNHVKLFFPSI